MIQPASREEILASPLWHMFDYDMESQLFELMRIEEALYRSASFLDHRVSHHNCPIVRYELKHMAELFPRLGENRSGIGFIFHIGHCGSTLLSRALGVSRHNLPIREPLTLRKLSADRRVLDTPMSFLQRDAWKWLLGTVLDSLARRFRPDQLNIVKATSTGNNLIEPILDESPASRAVLMYLPLESYIAGMLGTRSQGKDLYGQSRTRMSDWLEIEGAPELRLYDLKAPELAALSWLTSMNHMTRARDRFGGRTLMLDFEDLLDAPESRLAEVAAFFGLQDEATLIAGEFPAVSAAYSKRPELPYTPETRAQKLQRTRTEKAGEIEDGMVWARSMIGETPALAPCRGFVQ